MEIKRVCALYFSATGNTEKTVAAFAETLAEQLGVPWERLPFTKPAERERDYVFADTDLVVAVGMGLAMTFVLVCSNIVISALRKVIPAKVHLPCYIVIIATFVTVVQMVLQAFVPDLYKALGVYLALIVVNCIILGRAEMFACKNTVVDSALDGLGMGIGYILTMLLMSSIREIIGSGTWMGITIIPESVDRMTVMNSAPGGFFVFGCLMAGCVWLERKLNKPIERKSCGDVMLEKIDAAKEEQKEGAAQ